MQIKDYILNGDVVFVEKEKKTQKPKEVTFSIVYENDTDFILKRRSQRVEKELVCLVSQGQIYIKDCKNNEVENVETDKQVVNFKKDMEYIPSFEKLTWKPFIDWGFVKISAIWDCLINHKNAFKVLANKKLDPFENTRLVYDYERNPEQFKNVEKTEKLVRAVIPNINMTDEIFSKIAYNLKESNVDLNLVKENENLLSQLDNDDKRYILSSDNFYMCFTEYGCNFKALFTWLVYTIKYRNRLNFGGWFRNTDNFYISDYLDYLRMQKEMYGKLKEKYPDYWKSEKHIMNCKYNDWKKMNETKLFSLNQEKIKDLEFEDSVYKVIVPLQSADIIDEANQQQHCVASYVDKVRDGETHILFIRTRLAETESLLTVEVRPDKRIVQVRGFQNRPYNALEYGFMKKWAEAKELKLEVPNVVDIIP